MKQSSRFALQATAILMCIAPPMTHAQWSDPDDGVLIIRGGWLFDGISDTRRQNSGIVIRNGKIEEVDADVQQRILSNADVIDLQESDTILPGMIDLHAHYNLDLVDNGRVEEVVNNGIVHDPETLLRSAEGKIGPTGPDDHAGWELQVKPLREN